MQQTYTPDQQKKKKKQSFHKKMMVIYSVSRNYRVHKLAYHDSALEVFVLFYCEKVTGPKIQGKTKIFNSSILLRTFVHLQYGTAVLAAE